jgi:prevent-host-death family protein
MKGRSFLLLSAVGLSGCSSSENRGDLPNPGTEKGRAILAGKVILGMSPDEAYRAAGPFTYEVLGAPAGSFPPEVIFAQSKKPDENVKIRMRFCNSTQYDSTHREPFFVVFNCGKAVSIQTLEELEASEEYDAESEAIRAASQPVILESISQYYSPQRIGNDPDREIPIFIGLLKDSYAGEGAAIALSRIGRPAIPAVIAALSDADSRVRQHAMLALSYMGPVAAPAAPTLIASFEKHDDENFGHAAEALAWIFRLPRAVRPEKWLACPEASSPLGTTNSFAGHYRGRDFRRHQGRRGVWTAGVLDIRRGSKRPEDAEGGGKIPSAAEGVEKFRLVQKEGSMKIATSIEPVTTLKTKAAELIRRVQATGQPVIITQHGRPTAILQDVESFQKQREAFLLLKLLSQGERDYRQGRVRTHRQAKAHFTKKLKELRKLGGKV